MPQFAGRLSKCNFTSTAGIRAGTKCLQQLQKDLKQHFTRNPHQPIKPLLRCHSLAIDLLLKQLWQQMQLQHQELVLVAVGGYGRQEMFLFSDVDLLLLRPDLAKIDEKTVTRFMQCLWDIGLKAGHSVRSHSECLQIAKQNITALTSMDESRLLAGPVGIYKNLKTSLDPNHFGDAKKYYLERRAVLQERHKKYKNTEFRLEPNIKNAPGGLRDLQTLQWLAKRSLHQPRGTVGVINDKVLTRQEHRQLLEVRNALWRIRYGLHCVVNSPQEQLLFEYQLALAKLFKFADDGNERGVEKFMRHYFRRVRTGAELTHYLLQRYLEHLFDYANEKRTRINARFYRVDQTIGVYRQNLFEKNPETMLEVFALLSNNKDIDRINAETIRLLRSHRDLIDDSVRNHPKAKRHFLNIISGQYGAAYQLKRMSRYRILQRYLPEFDKITGKSQFDLYHIYSVDAHTIRVIEHMRSFRKPETKDELPEAYATFRELPQPELLYLAGLYHDIAKGRGGDHSVLGAQDVEDFASRHKLDARSVALLSWLVRNHLTMSMISQRQNLADPQVIANFADEVKNIIYLNYLYLLTIADIRGTNSQLWNSWRASLLYELYAKTKILLHRRTMASFSPHSKNLRMQQIGKVKKRIKTTFAKKPVAALMEQLGDQYFAQTRAEICQWQIASILKHKNHAEPLVVVNQSGKNVYTQICRVFVYAPNNKHLFSRVAIGFAQLNISVLHAHIITSADQAHSLNTYVIQRPDNSPISDADYVHITDHLTQVLAAKTPPRVQQQSVSRHLKTFRVRPHVFIAKQAEAEWILQLQCLNHPQVLARIGSVLVRQGIWLDYARIISLGERVEYLLTLNAEHNARLSQADFRKKLCNMLEGHTRI